MTDELSRPMRTYQGCCRGLCIGSRMVPVVWTFSVPSWSQPVKGVVGVRCEVFVPLLPNFVPVVAVGLVVPVAVVEILVVVGDLVAVQPVDGYALCLCW